MHVTVTQTIEYQWRDDQYGHTQVQTPTGTIVGRWECRNGKGRGTELLSNTTKEYDDDAADELLDTTELCQGLGTYTAEIVDGQITNVQWQG